MAEIVQPYIYIRGESGVEWERTCKKERESLSADYYRHAECHKLFLDTFPWPSFERQPLSWSLQLDILIL